MEEENVKYKSAFEIEKEEKDIKIREMTTGTM